jgi:DNA-binding XRE family transcriptional regulator
MMNRPVRTKTPSGEEIVILPAADFDRLVALAEDERDVANAERALAEFSEGPADFLTHAEMLALLDAPSPVAFWRKRRGLTQADLGSAVGVTQAYLAQIEGAKRTGDVQLYRRLAAALRVDLELVFPQIGQPKATRRSEKRRKK